MITVCLQLNLQYCRLCW